MPQTATASPNAARKTAPAPSVESLIRAAIDSTGSLNDRVVADVVALRLANQEKARLLDQALLRLIPGVRSARLRAAAKSVTNPSLKLGHSAHTLRVQADWKRWLEQSMTRENGVRIRVADATVPDLRAMAQERRKLAQSMHAEADRWDRIADTLAASGLDRVGDLPPQRI